MQVLFDGDILRYRLGFVAEHIKYYVLEKGHEKLGPIEKFTDKEEAEAYIASDDSLYYKEIRVAEHVAKCLHTVKLQIQAVLDALEVDRDDCRIFLSGKDNFRDKLVDYYKANRDRSKRPLHFKNITEYLIKNWNAEIVDGIEADDALGITQMENFNPGMGMTEETIIVTLDKDLDCIPGWHYNFVNKEKYFVQPEEADMMFYTQMLQGDSADNIPGLYKITGVKAMPNILFPISTMDDPKDMWMYVWNVYKAACDKKEVKITSKELYNKLVEIGKLLWMWRKPDDHWLPPTKKFKLLEVKV
jgi:dsDNA-binding SOS-regulon protein